MAHLNPDPLNAASRRTPDRWTRGNDADNIERYLEADGHKIWGWVIYRSTYDSEDDWAVFLHRLRARIEQSLSFHGGLDMLESLDYTIFEDRNLFDGASTSTIREHFRKWIATAPQEEQPERAGAARSQRYQFCIQVDAEALHSVVYDVPPPEEPDPSGKGWVKLISEWEPNSPPDSDDEEEDPIEGVTRHEIGWSRAAYQYVMVDIYCLIRSRHEWYREYRRPPTVILP